MKLTAQRIPNEFIKSIPRGFRLVRKEDQDFLLIESLFCRNGHNLMVDSVRIHNEASVKLKIVVNGEPGFVFVDAFWGSHAKLFSFIPRLAPDHPTLAEAYCPYCDVDLMEEYSCGHPGCGSQRSLLLTLPGIRNSIHVCARLGCPGHVLEVTGLPHELVDSVNTINYFGAGFEDIFGAV